MNRLRAYLNDAPYGTAASLARYLKVTPVMVAQWANSLKPVPVIRCVPLEQATLGALKRWDLRPTDWHEIWPELRGAKGAPPLPVPANPTETAHAG